MRKIKLTESQVKMLQLLKDELPNKKIVKLTSEQYNRIFESNGEFSMPPKPTSGSSKVSNNFKKGNKTIPDSNIKFESETADKADIGIFGQKIITFLKKTLSDPNNENVDKYWRDLNITSDKLIKDMFEIGLIKHTFIKGQKIFKVTKSDFTENVKKLYNKYFPDNIEENGINDIKQKFTNQLKKDDKPVPTKGQIRLKIAQRRQRELDRRRESEPHRIGEDENTSETINQYIKRVGGANMLPKHKYNTGDKVLCDMGDGTKEELTINKRTYYKSPKGPFTLTYKMIEYGDDMLFTSDMIIKSVKKLSEDNYPAGARNDSNAPYNQSDTPNNGIRPTEMVFDLVIDFLQMAIFEKDGKYFIFNYENFDKNEFADYADRDEDLEGYEDGMPMINYGDFEINEEIINNFVNDNYKHLSFGKGLNDYENGVNMVQIDQDIIDEILTYTKYVSPEIKNNVINILNNLTVSEVTAAAGSSGAFVGGMSGNAPIRGLSPADEMKNVVGEVEDNFDEIDKELANLKYNNFQHPTMGTYTIDKIHSKSEDDDKLTYRISLFKNEKLSESELFYTFSKKTGKDELIFNHKTELIRNAYDVFNELYALVFDGLKDVLKPSKDIQEQGIGNSGQYTTPGFPPSDFFGNKSEKGKGRVSKGETHKKPMYPKGKIVKVTERQLNLIKKTLSETSNQNDTAYPNGEFVDIDDCTKLNNNKVAQNGGCSTGAKDNVVKTKKTKNSVISSDALYSEVAKKTGRTIAEVKKIILRRKG